MSFTRLPITPRSNAPQPGSDGNFAQRYTKPSVITTADDEVSKIIPPSGSGSEFLYDKVDRSISGHVREVDDTPGNERLFESHRSGTSIEILPDGSRVLKIVGDDYIIALNGHDLIVGGNLNIVVQGDCDLLVKGNMKQKIGGDLETIVHGNYIQRVRGKSLYYSKDDMYIQSGGKLFLGSEEDSMLTSNNNVQVYSENKVAVQANEELTLKSKAELKINADADIHIQGAMTYINNGTGVVESSSYEYEDYDPGGGLEIASSVFEPSRQTVMSAITNAEIPDKEQDYVPYNKRKDIEQSNNQVTPWRLSI